MYISLLLLLLYLKKKLEIEMAKEDVTGNEDARGTLKHPFWYA